MPVNPLSVLGTDIQATQMLGVRAAPQVLQGQPHQLLPSQLLAHLVGFLKVGHDHGHFIRPETENKRCQRVWGHSPEHWRLRDKDHAGGNDTIFKIVLQL